MTPAPESAAPVVAAEPTGAALPPKVDPESLALRAQPGRAIRFRRGAVVGLAAGASLAVAATAWLALQPRSFRFVNQAAPVAEAPPPAADTLGQLPASYAEVPKLGPPLPGDLGRGILAQRQTSLAADDATSPAADRPAEVERQRRAADRQAALQSAVLVRAVGPADPAAPRQSEVSAAPDPGAAAAGGRLALDPDRDPNGQQRKADFLRESGQDVGGPGPALAAATSPYQLNAGSVIAASLITGLRSDLPGLVIAQVTERVFDSATGQTELIPQGARLIGRYDSVVAYGQTRAQVAWQRLVLPDGRSITLDNLPATDPSGYAGLADRVDAHGWALVKGTALSTLLGLGTNLSFSHESDLAQAIRQSGQQSVARANDQLTAQNLRVQPTLTVRPGAPVRLIVERDLVLPPWPAAEPVR